MLLNKGSKKEGGIARILLEQDQSKTIARMLLINNLKENHYTHAVGQKI